MFSKKEITKERNNMYWHLFSKERKKKKKEGKPCMSDHQTSNDLTRLIVDQSIP